MAAISWELLGRSAQRTLARRGERLWLGLGLLGPLAICTWTILKPFNLLQAYHNLQQCAIWLAGWYTALPILYACSVWLRPQPAGEEDLRHLPLSARHFLLARAAELTLTPLRCAALTLPLWFIVLAYVRVPYTQQRVMEEWVWWGDVVTVHWGVRLAWVTVALLGAILLPAATALLIHETVRPMFARLALLLGPALLVYALTRFTPEQLRVPYSTVRALYAPAFWGVALILLGGVLLAGWLRPRTRLALAAMLAILAVAAFAAPRFGGAVGRDIQRTAGLTLRTVHLADLWTLQHLSAPRNVRLLFDRSTSAVLLKWRDLPPEPAYPQMDGYDWDAPELQAYRKQMEARHAAYARLPRVPMWVGAGLWPLLVALAGWGGLLLAAGRPREAGAGQ
jgi:hypothetical protein